MTNLGKRIGQVIGLQALYIKDGLYTGVWSGVNLKIEGFDDFYNP